MSDVVEKSKMLMTMVNLKLNRQEMARVMKLLSDKVQGAQDETSALRVGGYGGAVVGGGMAAAALAGGPVSLAAAGMVSVVSGSFLTGASIYEWFSTSGYLKVWDDLYKKDTELVNQLSSYTGLNRGGLAYGVFQTGVGASSNVPPQVEIKGYNVQNTAGILSALSLPMNVYSFFKSLDEVLSREKTGLAKLMKECSDALEESIRTIDTVIQQLTSGVQQVQLR